MEIGISTACLSRLKETEDALAYIKELGAESCEIYLQTFYEYRPEFAKKFAPCAEGVEVRSVRTLANNFEPQLFCASRRVRGDGFYWLDQIMRSVQLFGAKNYTLQGLITTQDSTEDFDGWGGYMREITGFCARYGIRLSVENSVTGIYNRPYIFQELKNRCPELSGVFDLENARRSGYPYTMYLRDMRGAISYARISDVDEKGKICLPGKGVSDFAEIFSQLKAVGFDGPVLISTPEFGDLTELKTSLEFLRETAEKA